eukprot:2850136-Rhodomonas_salina.3
MRRSKGGSEGGKEGGKKLGKEREGERARKGGRERKGGLYIAAVTAVTAKGTPHVNMRLQNATQVRESRTLGQEGGRGESVTAPRESVTAQ